MIGYDVAQALPELRAQANSLQVDLATITRFGPSVFDPDTGLLTPSETVIFTGLPCQLRKPATTLETQALYGEEQVTKSRFIACFPHTVTGVELDDVITFTTAGDPEALVRAFRVIAIPTMTFLVSRNYGVEVAE